MVGHADGSGASASVAEGRALLAHSGLWMDAREALCTITAPTHGGGIVVCSNDNPMGRVLALSAQADLRQRCANGFAVMAQHHEGRFPWQTRSPLRLLRSIGSSYSSLKRTPFSTQVFTIWRHCGSVRSGQWR